MKRFSILAASVVLLLAASAHAQKAESDSILGNWLTEDDKSIVEIHKCNEQYCGRIVWLKEPKNPDRTEKRDKENPDPDKRDRKIVGLKIVWGFNYDGNNRWVDGRIYDPESGKTYSCKISLKDEKLKVRGYIGFSLIGRTTIWSRKQ